MKHSPIIPFKKLSNTKAWKVTSLIVRIRSKGICYTCGKTTLFKKLVAGHFREKLGNANTYFDYDNLRAQCSWYCNRQLHGAKDIYAKKLLEEIGKERFNNLFKKGQKSKQWTKEEMKEMAEERSRELELINKYKQ